jgi:hypothetical protein
MTLNFPGIFVEMSVVLPTAGSPKWHPAALTLAGWRMLSYPFFCLPAWWLVGKGLDGLLRRRRLHWAMLLTGSILSLLFLVLVVGILTSPAGDRADMAWLLPGCGFWTIAFGVLPLAWVRQRRRQDGAGTA